MQNMITQVVNDIISNYKALISLLPMPAQSFVSFFLIVLLIFVYAVFIWKFYRFVATKNIFHLNLRQYNRASFPLIEKTVAIALYIIEYVIVLPFMIFFWFGVFALFLAILTKLEVGIILLISATIIGAIRISAYYSEDLSKDLAKLLPFNLLAIALLNPSFFSIDGIVSRFEIIPNFISQIAIYLFFIIVLEIILRFFEFISSMIDIREESE